MASSLYCIKLFTLSLLLSRSWAHFSTAIPTLPQPSSAFLAADTLRLRGYSIFASLLVSISSTANYSGTLLAPPDFAFSFASTKILNHHRPPPRPSIPVLLYHTLRPPLILTWPTLSSRDDGDELRTFYNNNCLHLFRSSRTNQLSISSSPFNNPIASVKIHQPDLYVDENLIVHGIDGVLNPSFATRCSVTYSDPTADTVTHQVNRLFLDRAMRALHRNGYNVVASAMNIRRSDLLPLTSVTVLAVSDENLFMTPGGYHYDFRHHVIPMRQRFIDFSKMAAGGVQFYTLSPNKTVVVESNGGAVTVDGVSVGMTEVYHNRWMVVLSILSSLDDVAESQLSLPADSVPSPPLAVSENRDFVGVLSPASTVRGSVNGIPHRIPPPAPAQTEESDDKSPVLAPEAADDYSADSVSVDAPSPAVEVDEDNIAPRKGRPRRSPSPSPAPSPAKDEVKVIHCDLNVVISNGVEGGDLLCPDKVDRVVRQLRETGRDDVEARLPLDAEDSTHSGGDLKISEHVNIADDVFFYT